MGLIIGLLKRLIKCSVYFIILVAIIVFIPNLPPYTKFTSIFIESPQPRVGPLAPNGALNNAERLYIDKLLGPEAFQVYKGELYTSLATGEIVKISPGGHVTFVTKLGQPCSGLTQDHICGRPLGFQIDEKNDVLYVTDAYHGLWKVNLKNDKKQLLVPPQLAIEGRAPKLMNSIALGKNGDFYWTDSTSDFYLRDGAISSLTDPSGRLFQYSAATNQSKVLLDNLWFPNGVTISPDKQFVVVLETFQFRLLKYYIDGPKKGKSEVLVAGLPGTPDNVRALPDGSGMLVALYVTYDDDNPLITRSLAATPLVRKLLARVQRLIEIPFEYLNNLYPHVILEDIVYHIGHFKSISGSLPKQTGLVVVDWNGKVLESYYNTDGSLGHISDAIVFNNRLLTGSPHLQNYVGSVPVPPLLKKAFDNKAEAENAKQQKKPTEAPKPKVTEKPKVAVKKEVVQEKPMPQKQVKPAEAAKRPPPVVQEKPIPQKQVKPAEAAKPPPPVVQEKPMPQKQVKPAEAAKPPPPSPVQKPVTPKPTEQPKPSEQKPGPSKQEPVKVTTPPKQEKPTSKPEIKTPTTKATAKPTSQTPLPAKKTPETKPTPKPQVKQAKPTVPESEFEMPIVIKRKEEELKEINNKLAPENIPIREEIPSDTAKPNKDTLKVIKKDGPAEIPNPQL